MLSNLHEKNLVMAQWLFSVMPTPTQVLKEILTRVCRIFCGHEGKDDALMMWFFANCPIPERNDCVAHHPFILFCEDCPTLLYRLYHRSILSEQWKQQLLSRPYITKKCLELSSQKRTVLVTQWLFTLCPTYCQLRILHNGLFSPKITQLHLEQIHVQDYPMEWDRVDFYLVFEQLVHAKYVKQVKYVVSEWFDPLYGSDREFIHDCFIEVVKAGTISMVQWYLSHYPILHDSTSIDEDEIGFYTLNKSRYFIAACENSYEMARFMYQQFKTGIDMSYAIQPALTMAIICGHTVLLHWLVHHVDFPLQPSTLNWMTTQYATLFEVTERNNDGNVVAIQIMS